MYLPTVELTWLLWRTRSSSRRSWRWCHRHRHRHHQFPIIIIIIMNEPSLLNQVRESLPELRHIIQYTGTPTTEGVSPQKYHQHQKKIVSDYLLVPSNIRFCRGSSYWSWAESRRRRNLTQGSWSCSHQRYHNPHPHCHQQHNHHQH